MSQSTHKIGLLLRRFLIPSFAVSLYAYVKMRATISPRAEVELSPHLQLGRGTRVSSFTKIKVTNGPLITGQQCGFGTGCFVDPGSAGIRMGDHVICGPNVAVIATNYRYSSASTCSRNRVSRRGASPSAGMFGLVRTRSYLTARPSATIRSSWPTASSIAGSRRIRSSRAIQPRSLRSEIERADGRDETEGL